MNIAQRATPHVAVLLLAVFAAAIAAAPASASAISWPPKVTSTQDVVWYRSHATAKALPRRAHGLCPKVVIGVESMQDWNSIVAEYGLDFAAIQLVPVLRAAIVKVDDAQLAALRRKAPSDQRIRYVSPIRHERQTLNV